jgi:outer membrane protein, multidrug efflux system
MARNPDRRARYRALSATPALLLAACAVGPDYKRPEAPLPPNWRTDAPWREANPEDGKLKGDWWTIFGDAELERLERLALEQSPTLTIAAAHLEQARQTVRIDAAALYPQVTANTGADRAHTSLNRPLSAYGTPNSSVVQNEFSLGFGVRYEADLFGRVRRQVEGARAAADQSKADLENARLVLTSEVAADYFMLRELDLEIDLVAQGIDLERRSLDYVVQRHDGGAASGLDVAQQQALLDTTITQIELLNNQRVQFEHALAALSGEPAPTFTIAPTVIEPTPPPIPIGIPSDLLERRPDIASAERAMASANAQIGVAKAAFFPSFGLMANGGWDSAALSTLLQGPSVLWSFGVSAAQTVFDAGRTDASVKFASAGYTAAVGSYRQTILAAMQEVQDGVGGLAILGRARADAKAAVNSANRALSLANDRYSGGLVTYIDVITAQQTVITNQRTEAQIVGQQMTTSVFLVKALGGGWQGLAASN